MWIVTPRHVDYVVYITLDPFLSTRVITRKKKGTDVLCLFDWSCKISVDFYWRKTLFIQSFLNLSFNLSGCDISKFYIRPVSAPLRFHACSTFSDRTFNSDTYYGLFFYSLYESYFSCLFLWYYLLLYWFPCFPFNGHYETWGVPESNLFYFSFFYSFWLH